MNVAKDKRAIVLLAAYDYSSLYLTLKSLNHTIDNKEKVVIILNGKRGIRSAFVEDVAREWCRENANRFVVRPLNYGGDPYNSIKEVLENFAPLKYIDFICKIDDDLIPLKKNWLDNLHLQYVSQEQNASVGFVTSLINNNAWGFAELIEIFHKQKEYKEIMNYESDSGEGRVNAGDISNGVNGSIWQYPYLAKWCHEWTLLDIPNYINKTEKLKLKEISLDTHYSIGCIFFRKEFWFKIEKLNKVTNFDELSIHLFCKNNNLKKIAVMNEPMGHLYYFIQRKPNASLLPVFSSALAKYWNDEVFLSYPRFDAEINLMIQFEEFTMNSVLQNFNARDSIFIKIINFVKKKFLSRS